MLAPCDPLHGVASFPGPSVTLLLTYWRLPYPHFYRKYMTSPLRWARRWREKYPAAVRSVERNFQELLNLFLCPAHHRRYIESTNLIERPFKEVRKRTRPIRVFTNQAGCDRIIFGIVSRLNMWWRRKPLREFANNS
jgi:transposase-like protein